MPTFLQNSLDSLNRGWQQLYGQPAVGATPSTPVGRPVAPAATPVSLSPGVSPLFTSAPASLPTPIAQNPAIGQVASGNDGSSPQPWILSWFQNMFSNQNNQPVTLPQGATPMPISYNPEVGQTLGADDGGIGYGWPEGSYLVGPSGQPGSYVIGPSPGPGQSGEILATGADATTSPGAASTGGGGMGAGGVASSALGSIGSGLSDIGKNIAATKFTYQSPNIPLPKIPQFVPPSLAPNRNVSF